MPDLARSVRVATGATTATITVQSEIPSGVVWIVSQVSLEIVSAQVSVTAVLRKNLRFVSSTNQMPSTASGAPYLSLKAGDQMSAVWSGLVATDTAIMSLFYREIPWTDLTGLQIDVV
jgi:hypothetical protein